MKPYYPFTMRIKDRISEMFGIEQEYGTTSVVENEIEMLSHSRERYVQEINRYVMQISFLRNNFLDRREAYEELVAPKIDQDGNRILPYGFSLNGAYNQYKISKRNNPVFTEQEFNNIYSNLIGIAECERKKSELDTQITIHQEYQKRR